MVEAQLDVQLAVVAADGVVDLQGGAGRDGGEDLVEVVAVDVDETPFDQLRRRGIRLAGEVGEDADHQGQLLLLDGVADLDVVGDLHARRAHPVQLVLRTLGHGG